MSNLEEGWALDITTKNTTHYYRDGISLCKKAKLKHFMKMYDKNYVGSFFTGECSICAKKIKQELKIQR